MSEKYITLNHLETATKSLIAKIDEEINDLDETLSPVAKSGDYEDLENKPDLSQIETPTPDWNQDDDTANDYIQNKPAIKAGTGTNSIIQGNFNNIASGNFSHSQGSDAEATGAGAHAEGYNTLAVGGYSHAEGITTIAKGQNSHAEGSYGLGSGFKLTGAAGATTYTVGGNNAYYTLDTANLDRIKFWSYPDSSISSITVDENYALKTVTFTETLDANNAVSASSRTLYVYTESAGQTSHAEGLATLAAGQNSHAEGSYTQAIGNNSHSQGYLTFAQGENQFVSGKLNIPDATSAFIVGNGASTTNRSNAYTLDWSGNGVYSGKLTVGTGPTNNMDVATKQYVDNSLSTAIGNVNSFEVQRVTTLPTSNINNHTIYFVPKTGEASDVHDEYMYINNNWELIGTTAVDLNGYATESYVNTAIGNISTDLAGLSDTTITTPTAGQILIYDDTTSKWVNSAFNSVSAESDTNVNDMLDDFSLDYTSDFLSPNMWVGGRY